MQFLSCNNGHQNAITHLNNRKKSQIHATWIAPKDIQMVRNGVKFVYTIVEEKSRFWANEESPLLELLINSNSAANFQNELLTSVLFLIFFFQLLN